MKEITRRRFRVALHNGWREWGGGEIAQVRILKGLRKRGHTVAFYCNHEAVAEGARGQGLEPRISYLGGDLALHQAWRFSNELRRFEPDALVIGSYHKSMLTGIAGRMARVPANIVRIQVSTDVPDTLKYRFVMRRLADRIVVVADEIRQAYLAAGIPREKVIAIPSPVEPIPDQASAPTERVKKELGIPTGAPVVGSIGRLVGQKRFDRLVRAVALLPGDVHCVIVGEGEQRAELERMAPQLGVSDRVHLLGWRDDLPRIVAAFDVVAITSEVEGLAQAMSQALAAGVPVVSTAVSGANELLGNDSDGAGPGLIVGPDPAAIARGIGSLLSDPSRRRAMGETGRRIVAERFSQKHVVDGWEALLSAAVRVDA